MSPKHIGRYVCEFTGRHNIRPLEADDQMTDMGFGMVGKLLRYKDLIH